MMALSRSTELTRGAIEDIILKRGRKPSSFILQVLEILPTNDGLRYVLQLSDGNHFLFCGMSSHLNRQINTQQLDNNCIVSIQKYSLNTKDGKEYLCIEKMKVEKLSSEIIGTPLSIYDHERAVPANMIVPIACIDWQTKERYAIRARLTLKSSLSSWTRGHGKTIQMEWQDHTSKINAHAFNDMAEALETKLVLGKIYYVIGGWIVEANHQYSTTEHDFELRINPSVYVKQCLDPLMDDVLPSIWSDVHFVPIEKIQGVEPEKYIDVIGVCCTVTKPTDTTISEPNKEPRIAVTSTFQLVDESNCEISCTLWGLMAEMFENPGTPFIMVVKRAKVSEFRKRTLSIVSRSMMVLNPDIPEANELQSWYDVKGKAEIFTSISDEFLRSREVTVLLSMFRSFNDDNLKDLERELSTNGQKKTIQMVKESLKDIGYQMLAEDLKTKMQKRIENQQQYDSYLQALEGEKSFSLSFLKFLFIGPPRSGKTTMICRLIGKLINLETYPYKSPSTGLSNITEVIVKKQSQSLVSTAGLDWSPLCSSSQELQSECSFDEATRLFYHIIVSNLQQNVQERSKKVPLLSPPVYGVDSSSNHIQVGANEDAASSEITPVVASPSTESQMSDANKVEISSKPDSSNVIRHLTSEEKIEIDKVIAELNSLITSDRFDADKCVELLQHLINMIDVGGQPAFLEMLPTLTTGKALYAIFLKLNEKLDQYYPVKFLSTEDSNEVILENSYCPKDVIFKSLSSIDCFSSSSSKALLFGTYKDIATGEEIEEIQDNLDELIQSTKFADKDSNLLCRATDEKLVFEVDNMYGDVTELQSIKSDIQLIMNHHLPKESIPASWLMLFIALKRMEKHTIRLIQCRALADKFNIVGNLENALWFLHSHIGCLMYYPNIESVKDVVICNPQVVFDCVSRLIFEAFKTKKRILSMGTIQEFKLKGQFCLSDLQKVYSTELTECALNPEQLIDILQYHNIVAEINCQKTSLSTTVSSTSRRYLIPAVLKSACDEELLPQTGAKSFMIYFNCGFVPLGAFCAHTAHLISRHKVLFPHWKLTYSKHDPMRKNKVTFLVDGAYSVTLISRPTFYEIQVAPRAGAKRELSLQNTCYIVHQTIYESLKTVISEIKHKPRFNQDENEAIFRIGFKCTCDASSTDEHLMVVNNFNTKIATCCKDNITEIDLPKEHFIWFYKETVKSSPVKRQLTEPCIDDENFPVPKKLCLNEDIPTLKRSSEGSSLGYPSPPVSIAQMWNLSQLHKEGLDGSGVVVAILDTGINIQHLSFQNKLPGTVIGANYFENEVKDSWRTSSSHHGTACAAIAAGVNCGVAPAAKLVICRVLTDEVTVNSDEVYKALTNLKTCIEQNEQVDIISMSFGFDDIDKRIEQVIDDLSKLGCVLVAAAGNDGKFQKHLKYPASDKNVISVAAHKPTGQPSDFNPPIHVAVYAPGENLLVPSESNHNSMETYLTGSSAATPAIAGLIALLIQCSSLLSDTIKAEVRNITVLKNILSYDMKKRGCDLLAPHDLLNDILKDPRRLTEIVTKYVKIV